MLTKALNLVPCSKEAGRILAIAVLACLVGRLAVSLSGKQIVFLLLGLIVVSVSLSSLRSVLYLLIVVVIALPTTNELSRIGGIEVAGKNFKVVDVIYGLAVGSWLWQVLTKRMSLPGVRSSIPIYALFFVISISALADIMRYGQAQNTIMGLKSLSYYGIYFVVASALNGSEDIKKIHNAIIAGVLLYCLIVLSMYFWRANPLYNYMYAAEANRQAGRIGFANSMGISIGLPLVIVRWAISQSTRERTLCVLAGMLMFFVLILSGWRTGWATVALTVLLLFLLLFRKQEITSARFFQGLAVSFLAVLVIAGVLYSTGGSERFVLLQKRLETFQNVKTDSSVVYRIEKVKEAMPGIMEHLIVGAGFSTYYYNPRTGEYFPGSTFDESHTRILRMMGLLGYALFIWIFFWFSRKTLLIYHHAIDQAAKEFGVTFLAIFPSMVILTFTCTYLVGYDIIFIFATIFAIAARSAELLCEETGTLHYA